MDTVTDVLVAGAGPAGWAIAGACAHLGLDTVLVDPTPDRPWRSTYGAWQGELPAGLVGTVATGGHGSAIGTVAHELGWYYTVLDNGALRAALVSPGVRVRTGQVRPGDSDGAAVVVDATGQRRALLGGARRQPAAEQTAVGVVVDAAVAAPLVEPGRVLFMDWRPRHGERGWPSFLYGVPVAAGRVLLEETSLARRPGLGLAVLRRRLRTRLARHGIEAGDRAEERVRFVVDTPLPPRRVRNGPVVPFGAAAPLIHPATGFSVAAALRLAPRLAAAVRDGLDTSGPDSHRGDSPARAAAAAWRTVWSRRALAVHGLRRTGLEALLAMPPQQVPEFFDVFFGLPERHRWAYLTAREDLVGLAGAMRALFAAAPWPLRRHLVLRGLDFRDGPSEPDAVKQAQ
ncbi:MAG: lycopene cyclase family protein [Pseudonocardiaceae bacterium]|nr:lycopene cyclase family protein [Pseudonocardiaceae bacterium]